VPAKTTRDRILQVARAAFTRKGFANAGVSEICAQAGVSPPTLYYHFGSKDGLFEAVVEETVRLDGFCRLLREAVEEAEDPWDKLRAYVHTYLTAFPVVTLNPGLHLDDSTQLNDTSLRCFGLGLEASYQLAREILEDGMATGAFRAIAVDTTAACILGTVDSFIRSRVYLGVEYDREEVADCIVDLLAGGLRAGRHEGRGKRPLVR
jgi:AcrR family transcriptional regulator